MAGEVGTSGEEAGDNGRGWIMLGLSSKDSCFYPNGYGSQQWVLSWEGMVVVATQSKIQGKRKGRRKDREAVVSDQALVSRHNSLGPISGFAPREKKLLTWNLHHKDRREQVVGSGLKENHRLPASQPRSPRMATSSRVGVGQEARATKRESLGLYFSPVSVSTAVGCLLPLGSGTKVEAASWF